MTRQSFPEIPFDALKSQAQPARVERVWRRLELDLGAAPKRRTRAYFLAPAAALLIFAAGVAVGRRHAPSAEVAARAEPRPAVAAPGAAPALESEAPPPEPAPAQPRKRAHAARASHPADSDSGSYAASESDLTELGPALPVVTQPPAWEKLAEAGDFAAAQQSLRREGGFERALARASASQLLLLADVARASGNREQALRALRRVLSSYDSAEEAPLAAWMLGNLLDQLGDRAGAADAYATYRRLSPTGDFAEDAAARQVDAALSQGNLELGRRALEEYAENFPKGRRLAELRKRLSALEAPPDAAAATSTDADDEDDGAEPGADTKEPSAPHEK
jgi:tetratricopeptide (TPR) repeat protein